MPLTKRFASVAVVVVAASHLWLAGCARCLREETRVAYRQVCSSYSNGHCSSWTSESRTETYCAEREKGSASAAPPVAPVHTPAAPRGDRAEASALCKARPASRDAAGPALAMPIRRGALGPFVLGATRPMDVLGVLGCTYDLQDQSGWINNVIYRWSSGSLQFSFKGGRLVYVGGSLPNITTESGQPVVGMSVTDLEAAFGPKTTAGPRASYPALSLNVYFDDRSVAVQNVTLGEL
jgi:hypothetical protein